MEVHKVSIRNDKGNVSVSRKGLLVNERRVGWDTTFRDTRGTIIEVGLVLELFLQRDDSE